MDNRSRNLYCNRKVLRIACAAKDRGKQGSLSLKHMTLGLEIEIKNH